MSCGFNFFAVTSFFFDSDQINKLHEIEVGIAGAGGIGSNCAMILVRSGITRFRIADFDKVSTTNLNRQTYTREHIGQLKVECLLTQCQSINPDVMIRTYPVRIDKSTIHEIFDSCDIIIEAFDCAASKALLFGEYINSGKLVVGASGIAGIGNSETITIRKIRENCFIVGDETSAVSDTLKPFAPRVMVTAAKMTDIVMDWVLRKK